MFKLFCKLFLDDVTLLPEPFIWGRYQVCIHCDEHKSGWIRTFCNKCKCTISDKQTRFNKLAHPCEECPLKKWSKVENESEKC